MSMDTDAAAALAHAWDEGWNSEDVDQVHIGPASVILDYTVTFPDGRPPTSGADFLRVDDTGRVVEWRSHYPVDFTTAPLPGT